MSNVKLLLEEIENYINVLILDILPRKLGQAAYVGDYKVVEEIREQIIRVSGFLKTAQKLRQEWDVLFSKKVAGANISPHTPELPPPFPAGERGAETTPEAFYRLPILEALVELGGEAPGKKVLELVYEKVKDQLLASDLEPIPSGKDIRWHKNANWCRYKMKEEGLLASDSPRGIWEITSRGREELERLRR
nr:winged helix-turn-helix domain-containing protein [Moorella sulfitireducens]